MFPWQGSSSQLDTAAGNVLVFKEETKTTPKIHHYSILPMKHSLLFLIKLCAPLGRCYNLKFCAQLLTWCLSMLLLFCSK